MTLTETERKLLEDAALLLSKIGASKASEEIDYVLEEHENKVKVMSNEQFELIRIEENEISKKLERDFSFKRKVKF
mgnify:FL=1|jgi:hypothetical protein